MSTDHIPAWALDLHSALDDRMGTVIEHVSPDEVRSRTPVAGNTQPVGRWHGGATCVVAETLGSIGAWAHARSLGKIAFGIDINATHHRGVSEGYIHGVARPIHLGSTTSTWGIELRDDDNNLIATARITCALVDPR